MFLSGVCVIVGVCFDIVCERGFSCVWVGYEGFGLGMCVSLSVFEWCM